MPGKNSTPPFQSKLIPFRKEILEAWFVRTTLKQIQVFYFGSTSDDNCLRTNIL